MLHELHQIDPGEASTRAQTLQTRQIVRKKVRYELLSSGVRIGRASRPFPPSKLDRHLSMHPAFQFNPATERLQVDGCLHPSQGAPVEAQHNLLRGVPRSFGSPLADLHHVSPITEELSITTPPPSALPPASILAALASSGGVSVP